MVTLMEKFGISGGAIVATTLWETTA